MKHSGSREAVERKEIEREKNRIAFAIVLFLFIIAAVCFSVSIRGSDTFIYAFFVTAGLVFGFLELIFGKRSVLN